MRLNALRLGLAGGILWGLTMFVSTLIAIETGLGKQWLLLAENVYIGYHISYVGSLIGLVYGFIDGFIGLFLLAWIYNKLNRKSSA